MKTKVLAVVAAAAVAGGLVTAGGSAGATNVYSLFASMSGSHVNVLGSTVTSGYTAQSTIQGVSFPTSDSNEILSTQVTGLLSLGAITTQEQGTRITGGATVTASGETANVNLLNGLITIDAVKTAVSTTVTDAGNTTANAQTTFVGIHIPGVTIPVNVPANFNVTIPGIASLTLNAVQKTTTPTGALVQADALDLTLLKARGNDPIGSEIILNPSEVALANSSASASYNLGGFAYGSHVNASVTNLAKVLSGYTAESIMPSGGTKSQTQTNSTAAVNAAPIAQVGAIESSQEGETSPTIANSTENYSIGRVNLLNGLIKASAVTGSAEVTRAADGTLAPTASTNLVDLTIAGKAIPINVAPNTVINVANLATITLNEEVTTTNAAAVIGIDVKLTVAKYGLPIGAEIQLGVAEADIVAV